MGGIKQKHTEEKDGHRQQRADDQAVAQGLRPLGAGNHLLLGEVHLVESAGLVVKPRVLNNDLGFVALHREIDRVQIGTRYKIVRRVADAAGFVQQHTVHIHPLRVGSGLPGDAIGLPLFQRQQQPAGFVRCRRITVADAAGGKIAVGIQPSGVNLCQRAIQTNIVL